MFFYGFFWVFPMFLRCFPWFFPCVFLLCGSAEDLVGERLLLHHHGGAGDRAGHQGAKRRAA